MKKYLFSVVLFIEYIIAKKNPTYIYVEEEPKLIFYDWFRRKASFDVGLFVFVKSFYKQLNRI